jgi:hypothetical protein
LGGPRDGWRRSQMQSMDKARSEAQKKAGKTDHVAAKKASPRDREKLVDEAVEATFPASDPPSYMGGAATGGPRSSKRRSSET